MSRGGQLGDGGQRFEWAGVVAEGQRFEPVEVDGAGLEHGGGVGGGGGVAVGQGGQEGLLGLGHFLGRFLGVEAGSAEAVAGVGEAVEAEHPGHRVVDGRRLLFQHRAELVVGQERLVVGEGFGPTELVDVDGGAVSFAGDGGVVEAGAEATGEVGGGCVALALELAVHLGGGGVVQVLPAGLPGRGAVPPAEVVAGEERFEPFGEARFAGPVAADHQGQPWLGVEEEFGSGPDASEPFDRHRRQPDRHGSSGGAAGWRFDPLAAKGPLQVVVAVVGGPQQRSGVVVEPGSFRQGGERLVEAHGDLQRSMAARIVAARSAMPLSAASRSTEASRTSTSPMRRRS